MIEKSCNLVLDENIDKMSHFIKLYEDDYINKLTKKDSILNIQIIPNVHRIKVEKVAAAKHLIQSDE